MYGYMFGDVAHVPCATCKKSCGPFTDCVVHPEIGGGSCTNCHYGSMGNRCTLRTGTYVPRYLHIITNGPFGQERPPPAPPAPASAPRRRRRRRRNVCGSHTCRRGASRPSRSSRRPIGRPYRSWPGPWRRGSGSSKRSPTTRTWTSEPRATRAEGWRTRAGRTGVFVSRAGQQALREANGVNGAVRQHTCFYSFLFFRFRFIFLFLFFFFCFCLLLSI